MIVKFNSQKEEEKVITKFHGVDRHKAYSTISVLNRDGKEVNFQGACKDFHSYIKELGPEDAVVLEASNGAFYWADQIEAKGAQCYVLDPYKFKIIRDSWNKTDKQDARNMAKALWVYIVTGEFGIPTVYKPELPIRELRKLFSYYELLTKQITMHKNNIQAIITDDGNNLASKNKQTLMDQKHSDDILNTLKISNATMICVRSSLKAMWALEEQKEKITQEIILKSEGFETEVRLLMTIKGISAFTALAFLADIGDVKRFKKLKEMNAYLGLVSRVKGSGGKIINGHINRASRSLTRTIMTQSVIHFMSASRGLNQYYGDLKDRRGAGRARIALIRKICGIMRSMLLKKEEFRYKDEVAYKAKITKYERELKKIKLMKESEKST